MYNTPEIVGLMYGQQTTKPDPVPNRVLAQLSRHDPMRDTGQLSDENNALLSMYLTDLCGETVTNRAEIVLLRRENARLQRAQRTFGQKCADLFQLLWRSPRCLGAQIARGF
jgi:hypothetical protein